MKTEAVGLIYLWGAGYVLNMFLLKTQMSNMRGLIGFQKCELIFRENKDFRLISFDLLPESRSPSPTLYPPH